MKTLLTTFILCLFAFGAFAQFPQITIPNQQKTVLVDPIATSTKYFKFDNGDWGYDSTLVTVGILTSKVDFVNNTHFAKIILVDDVGSPINGTHPKRVKLSNGIVNNVRTKAYKRTVRNRIFNDTETKDYFNLGPWIKQY